MESVKLNRERGQILVQVAIMVTVLFAFVALALDGGQIYAGRRRMQNAADAGALAGARAICFDGASEDEARGVAEDYAINRNDADTATVGLPGDYTVVVTAEQTLDTFFAGVIGINEAQVRAEAAAKCGGSVSAGGLWPVAFRHDVYTDSIGCDEEFVVLTSDDEVLCAGDDCTCVNLSEGITETTSECEDLCNCAVIGPHLGSGNRGWLRLFEPEEGYPDPMCANEGVALACWLEYGHPGPVAVGDCVAEKGGMSWGNPEREAITLREHDVVNIILFDRLCDQAGDPEPLGGQTGSDDKAYRVDGFGCVEVIGYESPFSFPGCDGSPACQSGKNLKVVWVRKICDDEGSDAQSEPPDPYDLYCSTSTGSTSGVPPEDWESRSVSLIQWPPSGSP
jgi:hypothetical protein